MDENELTFTEVLEAVYTDLLNKEEQWQPMYCLCGYIMMSLQDYEEHRNKCQYGRAD